MYSLGELRSAINTPEYIPVEINRMYRRALCKFNSRKPRVSWPDEDWDTLLVLDACRYDVFQEFADLPGSTQSRYSPGSTSKETVRKIFANQKLYDTIYISANPWFERLRDEINADVYKFRFVDRPEGMLTPPPEHVTEAVLEEHTKHPRKRLIVHYMQPHQPYLGPHGARFPMEDDLFQTIVELNGRISKTELYDAYIENLEMALEEVKRLFDHLDGKFVVTADHGELLGENIGPLPVRDYGHHIGIHIDELIKVPWHVYQNKDRRKIVTEKPKKNDNIEVNIDERLQDLGYVV